MNLETWDLKLPAAVESTTTKLVRALERQRFVERLWQRDAGLWHPSAATQAGIARRMGWLDAPDQAQLGHARRIASATYRPALLIAPDDAGGAARLWLPQASDQLSLLDSWAPAAVDQAVAESRPGVVVAADRPSPALDALLAATAGIRTAAQAAVVAPPALLARLGARARVIAADENAGARFGALGSYGLVAAALAGRDLEAIAAGARAATEACRDASRLNPGIRLGAALAALAQHGYDLLLLRAAPSEQPIAEWIAGLLAGALSKHRRGFVPLVRSERPSVQPQPHSAQIVLRSPHGAAVAPQVPTIELRVADDRDMGALVAIMHFAVVVAASVIGVNPFDEPDTIAFERRLRQPVTARRPPPLAEPPAAVAELLDLPADARWLALVPYFAVDSSKRSELNTLSSRLEQRSGKPVALIEPLRHGWATQLLHAGRPDGYALALAPPPGASALDALVRARFELDVMAWRRMGRAFAVLDSF